MATSIVMSFAVAALVSMALTPAVRALAHRCGWLARPRPDRWHNRPVALMGGAAVFVATTAAVVAARGLQAGVSPALVAGAVVFVLGVWDDLRPLRPATKLVVEISAALGLVFLVGVPPVAGLPAVDLMVTLLWLVGITNAVNLLDNMDGLAAGVVLIAAAFVLLLGAGAAPAGHLIVVAALAGALAGFLPYNFNPASIFLGDGGSLFIGFLMASSVMSAGRPPGSASHAVVFVPAILLAVPILDTALVLSARLLSGQPVASGGRDHLSHRLVTLGLSERVAVLFLYGVSAAAGGVAVLVQGASGGLAALYLTVFVTLLTVFAVQVARIPVYRDHDFSRLAGQPFTPLLIDLAYRRRIFEVVLDLILVWVSYSAAFRLRFEGEAFAQFYPPFLRAMPVVIVCKIVGLWAAGVYGGVWRYLSTIDSLNYVKGVAFGSALALLSVLYLYRFEGFSRGVFILDALILTGLIFASRFSTRLLVESAGRRRAKGTPVLVYGAGPDSVIPLRELLANPAHGVRPVGLIDENPVIAGQRILGVPVLGTMATLDRVLERTGATQLIVATTAVGSEALARLSEICARHGACVRRARFVIDEP